MNRSPSFQVPSVRATVKRASWRHPFTAFAVSLILLSFPASGTDIARDFQDAPHLALLELDSSDIGGRLASLFMEQFRASGRWRIIEREEASVAAKGSGYKGSLNMTLEEARDLGSAMGAEAYVLMKAGTNRLSPPRNGAAFEAFASVFLVSGRSGKLLGWDFQISRSGTAANAERDLRTKLAQRPSAWERVISDGLRSEELARSFLIATGKLTPLDEGREEQTENGLYREPAPYRRIQPDLPPLAAEAGVTGTVDVLVDLDATGEVGQVEIERWAGYGLDDATIAAIKKLHFRPAMRNHLPVPARVLLRYNFRQTKPATEP